MKRNVALVVIMSSLAAFAAEPKVGATIAFRGGYGHQQYVSNALFKHRPIAEEMAKNGIDLCYYGGWGDGKDEVGGRGRESTSLRSLKQFNCIWLITDHEEQCPYKPEVTAAALKEYVEAGGGLVINHSIGRYPEAPVDAYWEKVYAELGIKLLREQTVDMSTAQKEDKYYSIFYTDTFADHPVTKDVPGLWFAFPIYSSTWGAAAFVPSSDWTSVVTTSDKGESNPRDKITNKVRYGVKGTYKGAKVPLVAVRTLGKGRIVYSAIHKDNSGWAFNLERWPNIVDRSVTNGKRSDAVKLLENAFKWASEPSMADPSFTKDYKPVEPNAPAYVRGEDFGKRWEEKASWTPLAPVDCAPKAKGLVGLRSSYAGGHSTVAEYAAAAKKLGLNFLVFADPLAELTPEKLDKLRADCAANTTDDFYCCPGVEFVDLSQMEWIVFSDKVSYPEMKPVLRDGRHYQIFDGKVMLQPRYYRCKNLYRGAPLNNKRIAEIGNFDVNLFWSNWVVPVAYDVDRPLYDNLPEILQAGPNVRRTGTISYTRVRSADELARAAAASVTCFSDLQTARSALNGQGSDANTRSVRGQAFVTLGPGVEIRDFRMARARGTDVVQLALRVTSAAGLREVRVEDGSKRTLARFDAKGERDFKATFTFEWDEQSYPQIIATDCAGSRAVSCAHWLYYYHAGLHRCGDNANLLAVNPQITMYVNLDLALCPPAKAMSYEMDHGHLSEAFFWERFTRAPRRSPSLMVSAHNELRLKDVAFPGEKVNQMPSSRTSFPLVMPNVVTIVDQLQGEWLVEPTRTEKNGTYMYCSMPPKVGENEYWRVHHRTYQLCDRKDGWWRAVYQENPPDYRGGFSIVEGEVTFLKDAEIERPLEVVRVSAGTPGGRVLRYGVPGAFVQGSVYAAIPSDRDWIELVGLSGCEGLVLTDDGTDEARTIKILAGRRGQKVRAGETIRYRVALGRFNEKPHGREYVDWFAGMMDGTRFVHEAVKGTARVDGFLELEAKDGEAAVTLGPTWFIQNFPVRVKGLVDNGSAFVSDGAKYVKPLAFCGRGETPRLRGRGVPAASEQDAYIELPLETRRTWRLMNRYLADDPALRFCYVPAIPGHEKASVQILNNTDRVITSRVRDLVSGETFEVTVPAGSLITR